jgi:anti-sigma factor RsiW
MTRPRPTERDLHAMIDERLDKARARELEAWLEEEAAHDERLASWKRGGDALRAVYDPIAAETPPLFLSLAARAAAARDEPRRASEPRASAAGPKPRRAPPASRSAAPLGTIVLSFLSGGAVALLVPAVARQILDPSQTSIFAGVLRVVAQITAYIGRALGLGT